MMGEQDQSYARGDRKAQTRSALKSYQGFAAENLADFSPAADH
jgi:hypothetical protein